MYCKECGFQLSDDAKFCPNCGTKIMVNGCGEIESNAVWGDIEKDETDQNSFNAQLNGKLHKDNHIVIGRQSQVEQTKIIRKQETNTAGIYVAYWSYENNEESELSPQWYVDSNGKGISRDYDYCSKGVAYNLTFVKKNSMWACCKLIDGHMTELTPFVFSDFDIDFYKDQAFSKYNIEVYSIVLYNHDRHILDSNMNLYKITKSWWPNVMESIVCAVLITFFVWCGISVFDFELPYWVYIVTFVIAIIWGLHGEGKAESLTKIRQF